MMNMLPPPHELDRSVRMQFRLYKRVAMQLAGREEVECSLYQLEFQRQKMGSTHASYS